MYAILAFDTEDVYFPPECRIDDIPGWLAQIMTEEEVTGTFFVMGDKARLLKERGRADVLEKMAKHEIASHQQGNCHPLIPEVLDGKGWEDGLAAMAAYEDAVAADLAEAFGKAPVAFSRHNDYFGPQHVALAGRRGLPYMYMIEQIPGSRRPLWYAGALTFLELADGFFGGFDRIYSRDEIFEARLRQLDDYLQERVDAGCEWVTVFGCHPVQVMARGWFEHYALASGVSRTPHDLGWRYAVKSADEEERAQANFRRLCRYLKQHTDVEVVGISEAARLFSTQPGQIARDALTFHAADVVAQEKPAFHAVYSPAEMTCGLAESILHHEQSGDLPDEVQRRDVLGPTSRPVVGSERDIVSHAELVDMCRQMVAAVSEDGCLPANLRVGDERVGVSQFLLLAARAYRALTAYEKYEKLRVRRVPRYPETAYAIDGWIRRHIGDHWAMPLDFSCDRLAELARLQAWSMKPAWLRPPLGAVADDERFAARRRA